MDGIGGDIVDAFGSLGDVGILLALIAIVVIDGVGFPTLPEVWLVVLFGVHADSLSWGVGLVVLGSVAALAGNLTLYSLVRAAKLPNWIRTKMRQYTQFLMVKDERLLLINKAAPIIPYTGAFIAVCEWDLRKSIAYIIIGSLAKFSFIVVLAWFSYDNLANDVAPLVSLALVAIILTASIVASVIYRRRHGLRGDSSRSQ